jgi:HTH-type transcriptional repressor of NAD biosynthesis genes
MTTAFVLMTAMPPTIGHLHLIQFANELAPRTRVLVTTQPSEPFANERWWAVREATEYMNRGDFIPHVVIEHFHKELEQDPSAPGFWETWDDIMWQQGFKSGDIVVSSEPYGQTLADRLGGIFMPYDPNRELYYTKATNIRNDPKKYFADILPEFQRHLVSTVTFFGAESTGKTTLSDEVSRVYNGHWLFEWARPYLETVGNDITVESMTRIWKGQAAIQEHARTWPNKPYIIQDTDLFSTVGYWEQPHWADVLGERPEGLLKDAQAMKSDLYVITQSNIPFERDGLRYGIDKRESPDQYWIDLAEREGLNYIVLKSDSPTGRMAELINPMNELWKSKADALFFDRKGL